jgi:hypothetical protein
MENPMKEHLIHLLPQNTQDGLGLCLSYITLDLSGTEIALPEGVQSVGMLGASLLVNVLARFAMRVIDKYFPPTKTDSHAK